MILLPLLREALGVVSSQKVVKRLAIPINAVFLYPW
jgi:hypothetical protein